MRATRPGTLAELLAELSAERRKELAAVHKLLRAKMPKGYQERVFNGMVVWEVPLATYPDTYNGQPLWYAALSVHQKHLALYLMGAYMLPDQREELKAAFKAAGKKLDMGKACIRFQAAADLPLPAIGKLIKALPPGRFIVRYEEVKKR